MKFGSKKENMNIYIFVIKFEKKKRILFRNGSQNKFCDIAQ